MSAAIEDERAVLAAPGYFRAPGRELASVLAHTEAIDAALGVRVCAIEAELKERARVRRPEGNVETWGKSMHGGRQTWVGLGTTQLQTHYDELDRICRAVDPRPDAHAVDLGAGYGRMGLVWGHHCRAGRFTGIEWVSERAEEANRVLSRYALCPARVTRQDLTAPDFVMPVADCYMIYDYGDRADVARTLDQLSELAREHRFTLVGRGGMTTKAIEARDPWRDPARCIQRDVLYAIYRAV
jgi:hypothetical protein